MIWNASIIPDKFFQVYLFQRLENFTSTCSDAPDPHDIDVLQRIKEKYSTNENDTEELSDWMSEFDEEYNVKMGILCFSVSGKLFGANSAHLVKAKSWAKVSQSTRFQDFD